MTQLNTSHPYDFLLDYDTFTVFIPNGSQDLKRLVPEILGKTVQSGTHSNMVKNLRVVHEAFAWSGGNFRGYTIGKGHFSSAQWGVSSRGVGDCASIGEGNTIELSGAVMQAVLP